MANINDKFSELLGKIDEKVLKTKLNNALETLKKGNLEELSKKINKVDKKDLMQKMDEFDMNKLKDMSIDVNEFKKNISDEDFKKLSKIIGTDGDKIVKKLKNMLK